MDDETQLTEQKNELEDTFIFSFIHDIKNMMAPITSRVEMLETMEMGREEEKETLRQIGSSCDAVMEVLNRMLKIYRTRTHMDAYTPRKADLSFVIIIVMDVMEERAKNKGIEIKNEVPDGCMVFTDREAILGVIVNLVGNAVKFTHKGGKIKISTVEEGDKIRVKVSDNGVGIDEEKITALLERNKYFNTPGTEGELGCGFGLLLCDSHLRRGGSRLEFANNADGGATFSFLLRKA